MDDGKSPDLSDTSIAVEDLAMLRTIMSELSDEERHVLYLKCVEQLPEESADTTVDTIARRVGKTGRTVRNILMRIRERYVERETIQ
jgi:DNA-directed RNA polymerase specialized sigma24 family protein